MTAMNTVLTSQLMAPGTVGPIMPKIQTDGAERFARSLS
jgi:hypothetical protein